MVEWVPGDYHAEAHELAVSKVLTYFIRDNIFLIFHMETRTRHSELTVVQDLDLSSRRGKKSLWVRF